MVAWLLDTPAPTESSATQTLMNAQETPPTWLDRWERDLDYTLTPGVPHVSVHALERAGPRVLVVRGPRVKPGPEAVAPGTAMHPPQSPETWDAAALRCPADSKPRHAITVLHAGDDVIPPWLGVDLACFDAGWKLHRQVRLLVATDPNGQVIRAFGLAWTEPRKLGPPPESRAMPEVPVRPAILDKRHRWMLGLPRGMQLAQLEEEPSPGWASDFEVARQPETGDLLLGHATPPELQRLLLLLDSDGVPVSALATGAMDKAGRLPTWHEGAWDAPLPTDAPDGVGPFVLLQRVGVPSDPGNLGRAWGQGGYVSWVVDPAPGRSAGVRVAPVPLPALAIEGLWDCDGDVPLRALNCGFHAMGAHANTQVEALRLTLVDGPAPRWQITPER